MKLYGTPSGSTNTLRVLFALAEKGQEAQVVPINLMRLEQKASDHVARHPFGVVPVLDDNGFVLTESRAIIQYLDARTAANPLTPTAPRERAQLQQWLSTEQAYFAPPAGVARKNLLWGKFVGHVPEPVAIAQAIQSLEHAYDVLDRALAGRDWLVGDGFSLAEVSFMAELDSMATIPELAHVVTARPSVRRWHQRIGARPTWQHVLEQKRVAQAAIQRAMQPAR